jgi:hypothetical protein
MGMKAARRNTRRKAIRPTPTAAITVRNSLLADIVLLML